MEAQILRISSSYAPPPPDSFVSPMAWGVGANVIDRFTGAGVAAEKLSFGRDTYSFDFPGTPSEFVAEFRDFYGPTMNAFEAAAKNGRVAEPEKELVDLFSSQNGSQRADATSIPATFLRVTVAL